MNAGSIAGLVSYALFLLYWYVFDMNPLGPVKWIGLWVPVVFMYMAVKRHREHELEGFITYAQAFTAGLFFSFIYSSLSAMLIYLHALADVGYVDKFITENLYAMGEAKDQLLALLSRDQYEEMLNEIKEITHGQLALSDFQSKLFGSVIIALIIAAVLKKNPPIFPTTDEQA